MINEKPQQQKTESIKSVFIEEAQNWSRIVIGVVLAMVLFNQLLIVNATIPTASMEDTIMTNDRVMALRQAYLFSDPARFDIIIFRYPGDDSLPFVKRIIGLPGETVTIRDGFVFINDSEFPLRDNFVKGPVSGNHGPFFVPDDSYFVLGDNRGNSSDSRTWTDPFVHRSRILGRAIFKYYRGFALFHY